MVRRPPWTWSDATGIFAFRCTATRPPPFPSPRQPSTTGSVTDLTPDLLLRGYATGIFPMAEARDDPEVFWVDPTRRGVLPLDGFHMSRSLARAMRRSTWHVRIDSDFAGVLDGCADRADTWINDEIRRLYLALHLRGRAHSVEIWDDDTLVGGVYGVTLGAAFFGESMFSHARDTSKIALVHLCARLWKGGYQLLDTQFVNDHLKQFGVYEISHGAYMNALQSALPLETDFLLEDMSEDTLIDAYFSMRDSGGSTDQ